MELPEAPSSLPGYDHINRFWDRSRKRFVAKILPGEFYVSRGDEYIATTLGSCVAACIWDPQVGIGGMNHFMLPLTNQAVDQVSWGQAQGMVDATRYGNYAMEHLINEVLKYGGVRSRLQAKAFGGASVLQMKSDVGFNNAHFVVEYLKVEGIPLVAKDLFDIRPRKVLFDPMTGKAKIKRLASMHNSTISEREQSYRRHLAEEPVEGDVELF